MTVPSALHGHQQIVFACEVHRGLHAGYIRWLRNQRWMSVEGWIQQQTRLVISGVAREQQLSLERVRELLDLRTSQRYFTPVGGDCGEIRNRPGTSPYRDELQRRKSRGRQQCGPHEFAPFHSSPILMRSTSALFIERATA